MNQLADVELQLVMQHPDARSLLQLARCSRPLMHAADSQFAWKNVDPLWISSTAMKLRSPSSLLLRYARLSLRWLPPSSVSLDESVDLLLSGPLIPHGLDLSACEDDLSFAHFCRILSHPSMQSLRLLHLRKVLITFGSPDSGEIIRLTVALPLLDTLRIDERLTHVQQWSILPNAPCLTSLSIAEGGLVATDSLVSVSSLA
jgi:hypothetical protein